MSQHHATVSDCTGGAIAPTTVIWWREDPERRVYDLLEVCPGPRPLSSDVWTRQLVQSPAKNGLWAAASFPWLGALTEELAARLRPPVSLEPEGDGSLSMAVLDGTGEVVEQRSGIASDPLYDACRTEAIALLARRLQQRTVRTDPLSSGSLLLRIRVDRGQPFLDLTPAVASGRTGVTGIPVIAIAPGLGAGGAQRFCGVIEPRDLEASPAEFDVTLNETAGVPLPGISLALPIDRIDRSANAVLARVEFEMPALHYPALEQRWPAQPPWGMRCHVVVSAPTQSG